MRETYQILSDHEGRAHILFLSGGVHSHLTHKQAKELAQLGNKEVEELAAHNAERTAAQDAQIIRYKERLADPADDVGKHALSIATEQIETYYLKLELAEAKALIEGQKAEILRLKAAPEAGASVSENL